MDSEMRFLADSMLGKLAKWLRVMGYDTYYRSHYPPGLMERLMKSGRFLLSRREDTVSRYNNAVLISADKVGAQLQEVLETLSLVPDPSTWFSRCLVCNDPLKDADADQARESVPEYVFHQNMPRVRLCPSCGRFYWAGSHRHRMIKQLETWGITTRTNPTLL